jgi:formylmethanofuran dehydrogenase subunit D
MSRAALSRLGVTPGSKVKVSGGGNCSITVTAQVKAGLRDDIIALMAADRQTVGVEEGQSVVVSAAGRGSRGTRLAEGCFMVHKGSKDDTDDPVIIRLSKQALDQLGLCSGDTAKIDTEQGASLTGTVREGDLASRHVGLREAARRKLRADLGARVTIRPDDEQVEVGRGL